MSKQLKSITFEKMHGAGNDFIIMDARDEQFPVQMIRDHAQMLCNRRTGIGADGILMLGPSESCSYTMHYLNADGSEAGMCGNGARCLAQFAVDLGFSRKLDFEINKKEYQAEVHPGYVSVKFPVNPEPVKIVIDGIEWLELNTGTEHVVSIRDANASVSEEQMRSTGRIIRNRSDLFPYGTNVNFAHYVNENLLKLITYERGVEDLTLACGTGAIATAIAWEFIKNHDANSGSDESAPSESDPSNPTEHHIQVDCPGGPLEVTFAVDRQRDRYHYRNIALHGPVVSVFKGTFTLPAFV